VVSVRSVRRIVIAMVSALVVTGSAGVATAAPPARGSVTITSPVDGATGDDVNVTVAGAAKRATTVVVTASGDPNAYETWVVKGEWATVVNPLPAGTTQICAEAFEAGVSVGRTCITYTAAVDGQYLSLFPDDAASVQSTFTAGGGCHGGSTVRLTLDGQSEEIYCDSYQYYRRYVDVPEGEHTPDVHLANPDRVLTMAKTMGYLPDRVRIIGCQPQDMDEMCQGLSPCVQRALPFAVKMVEETVNAWL